MSIVNTPDPAIRAAIVKQDLENVLHPIVQHRALEKAQLVIAGAQGSTIRDADGTEYLDGMSGLWCVNIGYGRTASYADVAQWGSVFGDDVLAAAILDRFLHHSHAIVIQGESYRLKASRRRQGKPESPTGAG